MVSLLVFTPAAIGLKPETVRDTVIVPGLERVTYKSYRRMVMERRERHDSCEDKQNFMCVVDR